MANKLSYTYFLLVFYLPFFLFINTNQSLLTKSHKPYKHNKLSEREPRAVGEDGEEGEEYVPKKRNENALTYHLIFICLFNH